MDVLVSGMYCEDVKELLVKVIKNRGWSKCSYVKELADLLYNKYGIEYEEWT